jgi:transposase
VTEHHRFLLELHLQHLTHLEQLIGRLNGRIEEAMAPFEEAVQRLITIPGVGRRVAEVVIAETGGDMRQFPSACHLASWAGMCPGNNESAGKRRTGRTTKGSQWLRQALIQAGWAASHTKDTYVAVRYHRLARYRGRKRALVAVGHQLLCIVYAVLSQGTTYVDLGPDYFDKRKSARLTRALVKRLEGLGHKVILQSGQVA